jgi:hypothetical protein
MRGLIDYPVLAAPAMGSPKGVILDITARFGGERDRPGFLLA